MISEKEAKHLQLGPHRVQNLSERSNFTVPSPEGKSAHLISWKKLLIKFLLLLLVRHLFLVAMHLFL